MTRIIILKRLKDIGLSSYEAKSYLSLLERDTLTVSEVSKLAGIPRPNAYEALEKLMSKGMCLSKPGDVKKYTASDPLLFQEKFLPETKLATEVELENLRKKEKEILEKNRLATEIDLENLRRKEKEILEKSKAATQTELENLRKKEKEILEKSKTAQENISTMVEELKPLYERTRLETNPLDYIEIIKDPHRIHKRIMQLHAEAKEEILVFTKPPFTGPRQRLKEQIDQQAEALKTGVQIRSIYEMATDEDEKKWQFEMIERCARGGEEARVLKKLPMKMAIFDSRIVMYALVDPVSKETSLTSQIVEHPALAESLKILFQTLWQQAEDYHILKG
jgi:sugar-specific transcriptional regulator TrmB